MSFHPPVPDAPSPASPSSTKEKVERVARRLHLDESSTSTLQRLVATRRKGKDGWSALAKDSLGVRISRELEKLTEEESRLLLRLLERGDFRVLEREDKTRAVLAVSAHTPGLGTIKIKKGSGSVVKNKAAKAADAFLARVGGIERLVEWLEVSENDPRMPLPLQNLLVIARRAPTKQLSRLLAETGASHAELVKWALMGASLIGDAEAALALKAGQPKAVRNLLRIAHSGLGKCGACRGTGATKEEEPRECQRCGGTGRRPEHPEAMSAIKLVAEAGRMLPQKGGDTNVNVGVKVEAPKAQGFFEDQMKFMQKMLAMPVPAPSAGTVDAEVVSEAQPEGRVEFVAEAPHNGEGGGVV